MLQEIISAIQSQSSFQEIIRAIHAGNPPENLALPRSARLPVLAALLRAVDVPILLITDRSDYALTLIDELALWTSDDLQLFFPEPNPLFYEKAPWGITTRRDRLLALTALAAHQIPGAPKPDKPPILIAPARAVMARTLPRRDFVKATRSLKTGQIIQLDELTRNWVSLGYEAVNTVIGPGQFARRGGILDIWPPAAENPTRLEFFGDEIDTLRYFNPSTQRTFKSHEKLLVTPAREYIVETNAPKVTAEDEEISEFHIPSLHPNPASILDYLPQNALVAIDNLDTFQDTILEFEEQAVSLRKDYIEDGTIPDDFPIPYLTWDQIQDSLPLNRTLALGPMGGSDDIEDMLTLAEQFSPNPRFGGQIKPLLEHLAQSATEGDEIVIVSRQVARLEELWIEHYKPIASPTLAPIFVKGSLADGWIFNTDTPPKIRLLTDGELFGWQRPRPRQRHRPVAEAPETAYADLNPGDWVVHVDHGVGKFIGLVKRVIENTEREYLCVEYAENDQLFVPVHGLLPKFFLTLSQGMLDSFEMFFSFHFLGHNRERSQ